jgi:TatD DNase family protein
MQLVDSHAHIYLPQFQDDIGEVMARAQDAGVVRIFMPNIDQASIPALHDVVDRFPDVCRPMMGLHPCSVTADVKDQLAQIEQLLHLRSYSAIGEVGTDLYWDKTYYPQQEMALCTQLEWAKSLRLPAVIHCRESVSQTIALVAEAQDGSLRGVFHCFTGTQEEARQIIDLGFLLGIGGVATFKNGGLDKVLPAIDMQYLLLETDSPYLSPAPHRGKRNEPARVADIARVIATITDRTVEDVAAATTRNSMTLFSEIP